MRVIRTRHRNRDRQSGNWVDQPLRHDPGPPGPDGISQGRSPWWAAVCRVVAPAGRQAGGVNRGAPIDRALVETPGFPNAPMSPRWGSGWGKQAPASMGLAPGAAPLANAVRPCGPGACRTLNDQPSTVSEPGTFEPVNLRTSSIPSSYPRLSIEQKKCFAPSRLGATSPPPHLR